MEMLLFDRAQKQIGRLLPGLVTPTEIDDLNGEHRLIFSYPSDAEWAEHIKESNFVACQDMDHNWQLYEITEVRDRIDTVEAVCDHAYYALAGMEFMSGACEGSALTALTRVLAGTGWEPGIVEPQASRTVSFQHVSPWTAVAEIADYWGGELRFRVDISGARIAHKYIDLLTRRGDVTGKRFEFGRDIRDIDITLNRSAVVTALYGWGQGESIPEDGEETERLTFADVEWVKGEGAELHPGGLTSPAPCDKPLGQFWVGDDAARQAYGRYDPEVGDFKHVFGEYDSQAQSPQALLWETWRQLQKRNEPLVNIKATVADLEQIPGFEHEKVRLGDTCYIILPDISPLAARVIRIMRRRKDPGSTEIELGNFRPVQGERISDIERRVKHADGRSGVWDRSRAINPDGTLPASALDGVIDAVQNQIRAGGGEVVMDDEGFRVLDTGDPETALGKLHAVARDGEAALVLGKRDSPLDPWEERVGMTSAGFQIHAEEVVAGTFTGDRLHIGEGVGFDPGYDPSTKETPSGAQGKANAAASAAEQAAKDYTDTHITYKVDIFSTGGLVFKNGVISTTLIARVYRGKDDITDLIDANHFRWTRVSDDPAGDAVWNDANYGGTKQIVVTQDDVFARATFVCEILEFENLEDAS